MSASTGSGHNAVNAYGRLVPKPAVSRCSKFSEDTALRRTAPSLRLYFPDAIALRERIRKGTGPNDGLVLHRYSEGPGDDSVCG